MGYIKIAFFLKINFKFVSLFLFKIGIKFIIFNSFFI